MVIATVGYVFSLTQIASQSKMAEGTYAINLMMQTADAVGGVEEMKTGSDAVQFTLNFGYYSVSREGTCSVEVEGERATVDHNVVKYTCGGVIYGSEKILDRGFSVAVYYPEVRDAGIVYHYSERGKTYVVFEQRPTVTVIDNPDGKVTVQITMVELTPKIEPLVLNRGPISYMFQEVNSTTWGPYTDSATVTVNVKEEVGEVTVTGTAIYVHIHIIKIRAR